MNTRIAFIIAFLAIQTMAGNLREGRLRTVKSYSFLHLFKHSSHQLEIKEVGKTEWKAETYASDWYVWAGYQEKFAEKQYKVELTVKLNKDVDQVINVILAKDGLEIMYQSRASAKTDVPVLAEGACPSPNVFA